MMNTAHVTRQCGDDPLNPHTGGQSPRNANTPFGAAHYDPSLVKMKPPNDLVGAVAVCVAMCQLIGTASGRKRTS